MVEYQRTRYLHVNPPFPLPPVVVTVPVHGDNQEAGFCMSALFVVAPPIELERALQDLLRSRLGLL